MGKTIPCEVHEGTKKVTFDLPKQKNVHKFSLLVTESIRYELKKNDFFDQQTVDYICVPAGKPYKYYELKLTNEKKENEEVEKIMLGRLKKSSYHSTRIEFLMKRSLSYILLNILKA